GVCAAVTAACFLPFAALSPHGMWASIARQLGRPLQIESLGSSVLLVAHHLFGIALFPDWSHGSNNLVGDAAHGLALEQSVLQVAAIIAVWFAFAHGPADMDRLLRASAAA